MTQGPVGTPAVLTGLPTTVPRTVPTDAANNRKITHLTR
jgi:hypothetical protein